MVTVNKKKIILGILIAVSIFVWARGLGVGFKFKVKPVAAREGAPPISLDIHKRQKARTAYEAWGRSPFMVTTGPASLGIELKLGGITYDPTTGKCCLINDKLVHVGEIIGDYRVIRINQDKVIVSDGAKDYELRLER